MFMEEKRLNLLNNPTNNQRVLDIQFGDERECLTVLDYQLGLAN
jgi:hypothetical protein